MAAQTLERTQDKKTLPVNPNEIREFQILQVGFQLLRSYRFMASKNFNDRSSLRISFLQTKDIVTGNTITADIKKVFIVFHKYDLSFRMPPPTTIITGDVLKKLFENGKDYALFRPILRAIVEKEPRIRAYLLKLLEPEQASEKRVEERINKSDVVVSQHRDAPMVETSFLWPLKAKELPTVEQMKAEKALEGTRPTLGKTIEAIGKNLPEGVKDIPSKTSQKIGLPIGSFIKRIPVTTLIPTLVGAGFGLISFGPAGALAMGLAGGLAANWIKDQAEGGGQPTIGSSPPTRDQGFQAQQVPTPGVTPNPTSIDSPVSSAQTVPTSGSPPGQSSQFPQSPRPQQPGSGQGNPVTPLEQAAGNLFRVVPRYGWVAFALLFLLFFMIMFFIPPLSQSPSNPTPPGTQPPGTQAQVTITKTGPGKVKIGQEIPYIITVTYIGSGTANITVSDTLDSQTFFRSASDNPAQQGGNVVWNLNNLLANTPKLIQLNVTPTVPPNNPGIWVINSASATITSTSGGGSGGDLACTKSMDSKQIDDFLLKGQYKAFLPNETDNAGNGFSKLADTYHINPAVMLAIGLVESELGNSYKNQPNAWAKKNAFGISHDEVTDSFSSWLEGADVAFKSVASYRCSDLACLYGPDKYNSKNTHYIADLTQRLSEIPHSNCGTGIPSGWPATGIIMQGPYEPDNSHANLNAVDIANAEGTNIYATLDGQASVIPNNTLSGCSSLNGYGNYVKITDNTTGNITLYGHLRDATVANGETVHTGQLIGHMDTTGWACGSHLHYELQGPLGSRSTPINNYVPSPIEIHSRVQNSYEK